MLASRITLSRALLDDRLTLLPQRRVRAEGAPLAESRDLAIRPYAFALTAADPDAKADATISLNSGDYILFLMGRLPLRRAMRRNRIAAEGDVSAAERFGEWFVGM